MPSCFLAPLIVVPVATVVRNRGSLVDDGVEAAVLVGGVVNGTDRTVGLDQRVLALHDVTVARLVLALDVAGVEVVDAVLERVLGWGLEGEGKEHGKSRISVFELFSIPFFCQLEHFWF